MRSTGLAYLLWLFFGFLGVHRFYCGRVGTGILWFLTGGLFVVGWVIDAFLIPDMVEEANREFRSHRQAYEPVYLPPGRTPNVGPPPPFVAGPVAAPMPEGRRVPGVAEEYRVVFCTQCGGSMQVPARSAGLAYACPACHTVLAVPV